MMPPAYPSGSIAGSVLPIRRAEELIATLPGVLSVRIVANPTGAVDEVHVLTTDAVPPKQTVRNIESALMAQLGLRVNHRKISIATTLDPSRATDGGRGGSAQGQEERVPLSGTSAPAVLVAPSAVTEPPVTEPLAPVPEVVVGRPTVARGAPGEALGEPLGEPLGEALSEATVTGGAGEASFPAGVRSAEAPGAVGARRLLLFEDVEVRRSRSRGAVCQVSVSRDGVVYTGEVEGPDTDQSRLELTARAALAAVALALAGVVRPERVPVLQGVRPVDAFERVFLLVVLQARGGRTPVVLTGTSEVRESPEAGVVVALLDATNRWLYAES